MINEKLYPLSYNKDFYTVIANDLIKGKQKMTLQEARLIRLVITQVVKEDKDLKTYTANIIELADFLGIPSSNLYRDMQQLCVSLAGRLILVSTGNPRDPWETIRWVDKAKYHGNSLITIKLHEDLRPYVLELDKWFTQYQYKEILSMSSYYAIRLYELIKCQVGIVQYKKEYIEYSVAELRVFFDLGKKLKQWQDFKTNVIEIALREINDKTDIMITTEYIKTSRSITSIRFFVSANHKTRKERQHERAIDS
jgi:plasmid replication initiation protein